MLLRDWRPDAEYSFLMLLHWKAAAPVYVINEAYIITTATHAHKLVISGNANHSGVKIWFKKQSWHACSLNKDVLHKGVEVQQSDLQVITEFVGAVSIT